MATLYIDHKNIRLQLEGARLCIFQDYKHSGSAPLGQIERIVCLGVTAFDSKVLSELSERQISLICINPRKADRAVIIAGHRHNEVQRRLNQYAAVNDSQTCQRWANLLVLHKLRAQQRLLKHIMSKRMDKRHPLFKAGKTLETQIMQLRRLREASVESLRGIEGAAAASYFQGFCQAFAPALEFTGRNRRPPKDPVNACLSLAYTMMHSDAVRACHIAGLDPMLGFYHRPAFGRDSLASDLIEPLRPYVDEWVWQLFRENMLQTAHFSKNQGACLLGKAGRKIFFGNYEPFARRHRKTLRRICQLLAKQLGTIRE